MLIDRASTEACGLSRHNETAYFRFEVRNTDDASRASRPYIRRGERWFHTRSVTSRRPLHRRPAGPCVWPDLEPMFSASSPASACQSVTVSGGSLGRSAGQSDTGVILMLRHTLVILGTAAVLGGCASSQTPTSPAQPSRDRSAGAGVRRTPAVARDVRARIFSGTQRSGLRRAEARLVRHLARPALQVHARIPVRESRRPHSAVAVRRALRKNGNLHHGRQASGCGPDRGRDHRSDADTHLYGPCLDRSDRGRRRTTAGRLGDRARCDAGGLFRQVRVGDADAEPHEESGRVVLGNAHKRPSDGHRRRTREYRHGLRTAIPRHRRQ